MLLRSKGFRSWFQHGTLWYSNRGFVRQCQQGDAIKVPVCEAASWQPNPHPSPPSKGRLVAPCGDNGVTANVRDVLARNAASRSSSPSYAQAVRSRRGGADVAALAPESSAASDLAPSAPGASCSQ